MPTLPGRLAPLAALLLSAVPCLAAPAVPAREAADPLPQGALVRVGTTRLRHAGSVINVVFAPDGKTLASCGNDSLVRLWDAATGKEIRRFEGHKGSLEGLAFSPDGKMILSAGNDGTARLWDVATAKEVRQFAGHRGTLTAVFSPDGKTVATKGGQDATGRLWETATGKELHTFKVARDTGSPLAFSPDGKTLAVVHPDFTLRLLDSTTAAEVQTFAGHGEPLNSLDFSPDGKVLASAGGDGLARLWDVSTGKEMRQLRGHEGVVCSVHFSPDGKLIATAGLDKTIRFWDAKTGEELRRAVGHTSLISEVGFSPDGKVLASASWDYTVRLWDPATGKELPQSAGPGPVHCAAISADGKLLVTGHAGGGVRLWDAATGKPRRAPLDFDGPVTAIALTPDGKYVAAGNAAAAFAVWDTSTGKQRRAWEGVKDPKIPRRRTPVLALSPDGKTLAVVGKDQGTEIDFLDTTTGEHLPTSPRRQVTDVEENLAYSPPHAMAFAPDGRLLLTASATDGIRLFETATGKEVRQLMPTPMERLGGIAFSPDGHSLAANTENAIRVWETATGGERLNRVEGDTSIRVERGAVALAAGGRLVAASLRAGTDLVVGPVAGNPKLRTVEGHDGPVTALAFAGGRLLSVGQDGTAIVWDVAGLKIEKAAAEKVDAEAAWSGLDAADPAKAFETIARLEEAPAVAVELLRRKLKPAAAADPKQVERLIARLDDDDFDKRESASKELADLSPQAEKALRKAVKDPPSAEAARRIKELLKKAEDGSVSAGRLREARALEVLEAVGNAEARKLLEELAKGAAEAALTQEAKAALNRVLPP